METRSIYLTVRVDIECPDEYNSSDLELATDLCLDGISLDEGHKCKVTDFEICGINE